MIKYSHTLFGPTPKTLTADVEGIGAVVFKIKQFGDDQYLEFRNDAIRQITDLGEEPQQGEAAIVVMNLAAELVKKSIDDDKTTLADCHRIIARTGGVQGDFIKSLAEAQGIGDLLFSGSADGEGQTDIPT